MKNSTSIKLFESKKIRTAWNETQEEWYFSVVDIVEVLTGSINPTDYLKKTAQTRHIARRLHRDKLSPDRNIKK